MVGDKPLHLPNHLCLKKTCKFLPFRYLKWTSSTEHHGIRRSLTPAEIRSRGIPDNWEEQRKLFLEK